MKIFNFLNFKKEKEPVRLAKKPKSKLLIKNGLIAEIPVEFILITIIMVCFFSLIMILMGHCTESGLWWNMPHA